MRDIKCVSFFFFFFSPNNTFLQKTRVNTILMTAKPTTYYFTVCRKMLLHVECTECSLRPDEKPINRLSRRNTLGPLRGGRDVRSENTVQTSGTANRSRRRLHAIAFRERVRSGDDDGGRGLGDGEKITGSVGTRRTRCWRYWARYHYPRSCRRRRALEPENFSPIAEQYACYSTTAKA